MAEVTFLLDGETGNLMLESSDRFPGELLREITDLIGSGWVLGAQSISSCCPRRPLPKGALRSACECTATTTTATPWTGSGNKRVLDIAAMRPPPGSSRPSNRLPGKLS